MNQHPITGLNIRLVDQPFPSGNGDQRQYCRFGHRQVLGFVRDQRRINLHKVGECTLATPYAAGAAVDLIADGKAADTFTHCTHRTGEITVQDGGEVVSETGEISAADFVVQRVDATGGNGDH